jgi:hypothetical protein
MKRRLTICILLAGTVACLPKRRSENDLELDGKGKKLSMDEVSGYDGKPSASPKKGKGAKAAQKKQKLAAAKGSGDVGAEPKESAAPELEARCTQLITQELPKFQQLLTLLDPKAQAMLDASTLAALRGLSVQHCAEATTRARAIAAVTSLADSASGRIGMVLPLTGARGKLATLIVQGMRAAFADANLKFDDLVLLKDSGGVAANAERAFAELVLKDRVSLVVGGMEQAEAEALAKRSAEVSMPTILLSREREPAAASSFAFRVYPDEQRLAETLAAAAKKRSWSRIAILKPAGGKSNRVAQYFAQAVKGQGGQVLFDLIYTPGNYDSMSAAARQLFRTDASQRKDEYRLAYKQARERAAKEGVPFDPRMVLLKPIIDFDAIFLPDDFRTARHFAKLFKFHMVDKIALMGNHEWRSPGLIEPFDELFDGAVFADFIGSYAKLPASISAPTLGSPYFVHPQAVVPTDFKLIGYRVARVASQVARIKDVPRRQLPARMLEMTSESGATLGQGKVFAGDRNILWPTYLFTVQKSGLQLDSEQTAYQALPTEQRPAAQRMVTSSWIPTGASR